jgi:hypothetical protein
MKFEIFNNPNYFDLWCVRKAGDKDFDMTIHVATKAQAEHIKNVAESWVKQGQRDAFESAIHVVETYRVSVGNSAAGERAAEWTMENLKEIRDELRKMADEL